jgi:TolA-binding protein
MKSRTTRRERMSASVESIVIFAGRRLTPQCDSRRGASLGLVSTHAGIRQPRFRIWLPATIALFMTVLTTGVLWAVVARIPVVVADTTTLAAQVTKLEDMIHADIQSTGEKERSEAAIAELYNQDNKVSQDRTRANARVAELEDNRKQIQQRERDIFAGRTAQTENLKAHRETLRTVLGRDIITSDGPPLRYDAGPEPTPPFYGKTLAYRVLSRDYFNKWNAWKKAQAACDGLNKFQDMTGMELLQLQGRLESVNSQLRQLEETLTQLNARAEEITLQLKQYTAAPWKMWDDLDAKRRQLASTAAARTAFWLFDIPTLLSCLFTTAIAYSRMFLITGRFGTRQLA